MLWFGEVVILIVAVQFFGHSVYLLLMHKTIIYYFRSKMWRFQRIPPPQITSTPSFGGYWNVKLFGSVHWHQKWLGRNLDLWPNMALRICNFLARRTHSFSNVFFLGGVSQLQLALSWIGHIHNGPKATFILQCNFKTYRRGRAVDM